MRSKIRRRRYIPGGVRDWLWLIFISALAASAWVPLLMDGDSLAPVKRVTAASRISTVQPQPEYIEMPTINLDSSVKDFENKIGASASVVVHDRTNDLIYTHNADKVIKTASLYKLFVADRVLQMVDSGSVELSDAVIAGLDVSECLELMITVSNNECGVSLQKLISPYTYDRVLEARGYTDTTVSGYYPTTTAKDFNTLLSDIYNREYLSKASQSHLIDLLEAQQLDTRLPALLPDNVIVAHKTADLDDVAHDAGVVTFEDQEYAITLMTEGSKLERTKLHQEMSRLSKAIYLEMNSR